jgi:hypothetical protein
VSLSALSDNTSQTLAGKFDVVSELACSSKSWKYTKRFQHFQCELLPKEVFKNRMWNPLWKQMYTKAM